SGRSTLPPGFNPSAPRPGDWPSIAAVAGAATRPRNNLPPAAILPEKLVHFSGRVIPGPFAGLIGRQRDPWLIEASPYDPTAPPPYGACPGYEFDPQRRPRLQGKARGKRFQAPSLELPQGVGRGRLGDRLGLLRHIDAQRRDLDRAAAAGSFDRYRQGSVALLTDPRVRRALDVTNAEPRVQDRYGRNA